MVPAALGLPALGGLVFLAVTVEGGSIDDSVCCPSMRCGTQKDAGDRRA